MFRPHPSLKIALRNSQAWEDRKIEAYWEEWAKFATISKNDDYQSLFMHSQALITDCGSFLIEYFVTGKPLIHLISPTVKVQPIECAKTYFDSLYKVHNLKELGDVLKAVLEEGKDQMREARLSALRRAGLADNFAAKKIISYLNNELS